MVTFLCTAGELGPCSRPQAKPRECVGQETVKGRELQGVSPFLEGWRDPRARADCVGNMET